MSWRLRKADGPFRPVNTNQQRFRDSDGALLVRRSPQCGAAEELISDVVMSLGCIFPGMMLTRSRPGPPPTLCLWIPYAFVRDAPKQGTRLSFRPGDDNWLWRGQPWKTGGDTPFGP